MWDYNDKVRDHFLNPRNVGFIKDADGVGEVGSLACGDALRLMFKLDEKGAIAEVKFQTFGCASAIASSSALTEMIKGKSLAEAEQVTNQDIADYLGGLPEQKMHCSVMGREALEAAIKNYRTGKRGVKELEGKIICVCFGVTEKDIERAVRENRLSTVEEVTNYTKAGGGCGGCHEQIEEIIKHVLGEAAASCPTIKPPEKPAPRKLTNIQKIGLITETLEREVRPALMRDGGDIELVDVEGDKVLVTLRGNCAQCRVSSITLREVVQAKLREFVSPELVVLEV